MFTHEFRPKRGGAGMVCEQLAETLGRSDREVTVWGPEYVERQDETFSPAYHLRAIPGLKGTLNPGCLLATARFVLRERSGILQDAVIYLAEPGPISAFFYLTLFSRRFWKKLTLTLHGSEIERYRRNPLSAWLFKRLLRKVDIVHVLSSYNAEKLTEWIPGIQDKLVQGYGMMLPGESLPDPNPDTGKEKTKLQLLCVGRIHPRKGQLELLKAVRSLDAELQRGLKVRLLGQLVKDAYFRQLRDVADSCEADIEFAGGVTDDELEEAYREADLFALTSVPYRSSIEGLGLVYLEASRYGLPILAHQIGGVSDVVVHGRNGYLSASGDTAQLAANISILIRNPVLRKQFGEAGRQMVAERSWQDVADRLFGEA